MLYSKSNKMKKGIEINDKNAKYLIDTGNELYVANFAIIYGN